MRARVSATHRHTDELEVAEGSTETIQVLALRMNEDLPVAFEAVKLGEADSSSKEIEHSLDVWDRVGVFHRPAVHVLAVDSQTPVTCTWLRNEKDRVQPVGPRTANNVGVAEHVQMVFL